MQLEESAKGTARHEPREQRDHEQYKSDMMTGEARRQKSGD